MSDTDTLANLLAEHRHHVITGTSTTKEPWSTCLCGFKSWGMEQREAHLAAVVAESGWLADIRAKDKSVVDLMRSLSINPTIPEGIRSLMKSALDNTTDRT